MVLGNLVGKTPKQGLDGDVDLDLSKHPTAHVTVHILADTTATFTYRHDKNAVSFTLSTLVKGDWLYGVKTFEQASGKSICYLN